MIRLSEVVTNARSSTRLLGAPTTARLHFMKAIPAKFQKPTTRVKVPGLADDIQIHTRGTDLQVVLQTFEDRDYALGWCRPYQEHIHALCKQTLADGQIPLIIDVGANMGASTRLFADAYPDCHVYAVEPEPGNFRMLQANTEGHPRITLFKAALWDQTATLSQVCEGSGWGCRIQEGKGVVSTPSVTIPELLARDSRMRPIIVKIDIEGAEVQALRSNNAWVDDVPLMIYEQHDNLWEWLGPWQGSGHAFNAPLSRRVREKLHRGENDYAFLHPDELLSSSSLKNIASYRAI